MLNIEVVYALEHQQSLLSVKVEKGADVQAAVEKSGILNKYPQIELGKTPVGIFSKKCKWDDLLRDGDRIEIYRPLIADPKEVRKRRAEQAKAAKQ
ncbi:RnfH family protein [Pelagibaculum spongiae]|uniref:UPF0125 protein DC094_02975 n=1 Tax=Pelagibaculum spongiae TaxID=2080658 RepID=A0A2V1H212_9GAMM|nr:RnfH family protein [Pelagibaculum spongiae]PVZ72000.1 RnfH family protein [Pelagibaculum spongiae]